MLIVAGLIAVKYSQPSQSGERMASSPNSSRSQARLFLHESIGWMKTAGIALTIAGVALLYGGKNERV